MIERNRRQDGSERLINHIRCIEPAAQSCFQKDNVRRIFREGHKCCGCRNFEEGDRFPAIGSLGAAQDVGEVPLTDGLPAALPRQHDPLVEPAQMGRDERMRAIARRFKNRF